MSTKPPSDDMAVEYDFSAGERGRLTKRLEDGYDVVIDGDEDHAIHGTPAQVRAAQARREHRERRGKSVSAPDVSNDDLEIPEITDFTGAEVGKYYQAYQAWKKRHVVLDPDLTSDFPDSESVNMTLRRVAQARRRRNRVPTS